MDILGVGSEESSSALGRTGLIETLLFHKGYPRLVPQFFSHVNAGYCWLEGMYLLTPTGLMLSIMYQLDNVADN